MMNESNNCSSNYGEVVLQQVNVLASCYIVDSTVSLKGLHYCTTGVAGMLPSFEIRLEDVYVTTFNHADSLS